MIGSSALRYLKTLLIFEMNKPKPFVTSRLLTVANNSSVFSLSNSHKVMPYRFASTEHSNKNRDENIVWVDMELTGLDLDKDHVLEVACLVTDGQLNVIAEGPDIVIRQPRKVLEDMNDWSCKQHRESGLTHQSETSDVSLKEAERLLLNFVREWTPFQKCPLGGNTVYMDRFFLKKHMPEFEQHFHYRIIDVSSVKELCRRWYPETSAEQPNKKDLSKHRAMNDIKASVGELKFYKSKIFRRAEVGEAMGMSWC